MSRFSRNYFASVVCSCAKAARDHACKHYNFVFRTLNWYTAKICIEKLNVPEHFNLIGINEHLKKILGDVFFHFCYVSSKIKLRLDTLEFGEFFVGKETMSIFQEVLGKCKHLTMFSLITVPVLLTVCLRR